MNKYSTLLTPFYTAIARMCDVKALDAAAKRIHLKYTETPAQPLKGLPEHVAYALCRMPATFAAFLRALSHVVQVIPSFSPHSVLDIGCGPGTALLGSFLTFPSLSCGTGLETSSEFCGIAEKLFSEISAVSSCHVLRCDLKKQAEGEGSLDLMTAAYVMGELSKPVQDQWLTFAKKRAKVVVLVEPGTPAGWQCLMQCRDSILSLGGSILAPCPHAKLCPFTGTDAWCHEAVRVQRTSLHRRLKGGELGYEDEKFSYLAVTFDPQLPREVPPCRIVHAPRHRHGHTHFVLCTYRGCLEPAIISRKHKELYRLAREAKWGDSLYGSVPAIS